MQLRRKWVHAWVGMKGTVTRAVMISAIATNTRVNLRRRFLTKNRRIWSSLIWIV